MGVGWETIGIIICTIRYGLPNLLRQERTNGLHRLSVGLFPSILFKLTLPNPLSCALLLEEIKEDKD